MINLSIKHLLTLCAVAILLTDSTAHTINRRYTEKGDLVAFGQLPPKPESECVVVYSVELEQSLIELYIDADAMMSDYAKSEEMLSIAENKPTNFVHFYILSRKCYSALST